MNTRIESAFTSSASCARDTSTCTPKDSPRSGCSSMEEASGTALHGEELSFWRNGATDVNEMPGAMGSVTATSSMRTRTGSSYSTGTTSPEPETSLTPDTPRRNAAFSGIPQSVNDGKAVITRRAAA